MVRKKFIYESPRQDKSRRFRRAPPERSAELGDGGGHSGADDGIHVTVNRTDCSRIVDAEIRSHAYMPLGPFIYMRLEAYEILRTCAALRGSLIN